MCDSAQFLSPLRKQKWVNCCGGQTALHSEFQTSPEYIVKHGLNFLKFVCVHVLYTDTCVGVHACLEAGGGH